MIYSRNLVALFLLALSFASCKKNEEQEVDTSSVSLNVVSENLDEALFTCRSVKDVQIFLDKHPYLAESYFMDSPVPENQLAEHLFTIAQNPALRGFRQQLDSLIGNREEVLIAPLQKAFKQIRHHYPDFKSPKVEFMVTGFMGNDLFISDSLIIIGLDYFGGPLARYRPDVFDYQLRRYQKEYIVPSIVFFISNKYNRMNTSDVTLLGDMVGYGKGYEFVRQIMPDTPDSLILGYSEDNLRRTYNSQQDIWSFFITNKLLYEKSDLKKQKFISERPFTSEIGSKVPGGIGRWVGWRIVDMYRTENPDITLVELMQKDNPVSLLQESGYKGQPDEEE